MRDRSLQEVKDRLATLVSYELNEDDFYDVADKHLNERGTVENRLSEVYQNTLAEVSQKMNEMDNHMGMTPNCQLGCAFCCYFPIIVNRLEAKMLVHSIEQMEESRREDLKNHLTNYFKKYSSTIETCTSIDYENDPDAKLKYKRENLPCPLLDEEKQACKAYEARPLPCRTYVNYMDPKICAENHVPEEAVSFEFLYDGYMGALNEAAQAVYEEEDPDFLDYPSDVYQYDYLPAFLKEWMQEGRL
ncbi:YkgJ family cysteine cluster protein [Halalkalibacillus sediminis]|nr:YkgJ family cysteine cluster protein [Halalkalibacillus sediminis]